MKQNRIYTALRNLLFCMLASLVFAAIANAGDAGAATELPKGKQTSLGLYLNSSQAYGKWLAEPDKIKIFDVRTLEEYLFVGHAPMAWNIPLMVQTHEWDAEKGHFVMQPSPDFLEQVKALAAPDDTILVMCRSGGRSAKAVNQLAEAGYTNVYTITDGMEGDAIDDPQSVFNGQRLRNGWKNAGLPWTYELDPERIMATGAKPVAQDKE